MHDQFVGEILRHWRHLRGRTYELLDVLVDADLEKRLPFPESESLGYQFWCMLAMSDTIYTALAGKDFLNHGDGFNDAKQKITVDEIRTALKRSEERVIASLENTNLLSEGETSMSPLWIYLYLTEHEAHHHGQIINFIYALSMPIPPGWAEQWALTRA